MVSWVIRNQAEAQPGSRLPNLPLGTVTLHRHRSHHSCSSTLQTLESFQLGMVWVSIGGPTDPQTCYSDIHSFWRSINFDLHPTHPKSSNFGSCPNFTWSVTKLQQAPTEPDRTVTIGDLEGQHMRHCWATKSLSVSELQNWIKRKIDRTSPDISLLKTYGFPQTFQPTSDSRLKRSQEEDGARMVGTLAVLGTGTVGTMKHPAEAVPGT